MENEDRAPKIEQRKSAVILAAMTRNDLRGQVKNTPQYIAEALQMYRFLNIEAYISVNEADLQVSQISLYRSLIPVTGDYDVLAYGVLKLIIVKGYQYEWFRMIDINVKVEPSKYPLVYPYRVHGAIVFQLYA